jgi:hypothetical protein
MTVENIGDVTIAVEDEEQPQTEAPEVVEATESEETPEAEAPEVEEEADEIVLAGEEPKPATKESEPIRNLRKENREKEKRIRELEEKLQQSAPTPSAPKLGPRPKPEDFDFDDEKYEAAMEAHTRQKLEVEQSAKEAQRRAQEQQASWNQKIERMQTRLTEIRIDDDEKDAAVFAVKSTLSTLQQTALIQGSSDPAALTLALGSRPEKLKELAAHTDLVQFAVALGRLEGQMQVNKRKPSTQPERKIADTARGAPVEKQRDRLIEQSESTGDLTALVESMRAQKARK